MSQTQYAEGQPYEEFEAEFKRMEESGTAVAISSTPKKRQYRRKLDYTLSTSPKKKKFNPSKKKLTRAPKKAVNIIDIDFTFT